MKDDQAFNEYTDAQTIDVVSLINRKMAQLNPALRRIGQYIVDHPNRCKSITIKELSQACNVAESSVTRFVKEIGFISFAQMKIMLAESVINQQHIVADIESYIYENISPADTVETIFDKLIYRNINMLKETRLLVDNQQYSAAVDAIDQANLVAFVCFGSSAIAAEEAIMRFTRAGKKCIFFRDNTVQMMSAAILGKKDTIIGISNSGNTVAVVDALKTAGENGAKTIGITAFPDSALAKAADIALFSSNSVIKKGAADTWENTTSKISQLLVIDVLYGIYATRNASKIKKYLEGTYQSVSHTRE